MVEARTLDGVYGTVPDDLRAMIGGGCGMTVIEHAVRAGTPMGPAVPGSRLARLAEGQRLANKLIVDGWRPGLLAEELGVGRYVIAAWRRGRQAPTHEQLERMREIVQPDESGAV